MSELKCLCISSQTEDISRWAATGNRTLIESSTSSSVNRYTIAAMSQLTLASAGVSADSYTYFWSKSRVLV